jgi:DNA-binding MarR family transcriptional regulator
MTDVKQILFELEKTLQQIKGKQSDIFRENNFPVSKDQWLILERISEKEGSNQKDIAKDTLKDPAALTRMLDLLAEKGLVQRKASRSDRRTFDLYLTVEGSRLVNKVSPLTEKFNQSVSKSLSREDKKILLQILANMQDA